MTERLEHRPMTFVDVYGSGNLIYVSIKDREDFDRIALRLKDHGEDRNGHLLTKVLNRGRLRIVFQYWLKSRTYEAISADLAAARRAREAAP